MFINMKLIFSIITGVILAIMTFKIIKKDVIVIETNINEKCKK